MIVVTGATGQLGRQVVEGLLTRLPAAKIGISVRDPEKAATFKQQGVRVVQADFAEPEGLAEAFDGAEHVLIVSVNIMGDEAVRMHDNAIHAARKAGVKRILYTSHQCASPASAFVPGRTHASTEALLQASGLPFVSLRNGFYAESALFQLGGLQQTGKIALPEDGPVSWTARADLAQAAVAALTGAARFDGISPALTGPGTLNFEDVARMASSLLGREVVRETVSDGDFRAGLVAHGFPEALADGLLSLYTAARAHEFAVVDPTLERLLGRRPTTMAEILKAFLTKPEGSLFAGD